MAKYRVRILYRKFSMNNYLTQDIEIESTPEDIEKVASDLYTDFMKRDSFGYEIETCGYSIAKITPKKGECGDMKTKSIMQQLIDDELNYIIENCDGFGVPEAEKLTSSELDELKDIILNLAYRDVDDLIVRKLKTYIDNKEN